MVLNKITVKYKKYLLIVILLFCLKQNLYAIENKILFKIDNEIITSVEVFNYSKYLIALDENIKNLNDNEIFEITENLIKKEKIKKIKLKQEGLILELDEKIIDNYIKSIFSSKGINNINDYEEFLKSLDINFSAMKEKLIVNILWNNLIFKKFSNKLKINKEELKKQIKDQKNNTSISYLLSEIFFETLNKSEIDIKNKKIRDYIDIENFKKAALIYSNSDSASDGGNIGWINSKALSNNIRDTLSGLEIGDITDTIQVPGGFLIS